MDRSRSKRGYYEPDSPPPRSRPRYNDNNRRRPDHHHRRGNSGDRRGPPPPPPFLLPGAGLEGGPPPGAQITTFYRILCPESKFDDILADSISEIQAQTRAWISIHRNLPGDSVRVIETSDEAVREADGRPPQFSPAQDALIMLHRQIVDAPDLDEERDSRGKVTSRMVIPKLHVGCLLGKGGKIIEQMRNETKTHIRVLPRDPNTPRCVSLSEEVLQVAGDPNSVKRAIAVISDRLKESLHRDRGSFKRDRNFLPEEDFLPTNPVPPPVDDPFVRPEFNNNIINEGRFGDFGEGIVFRMLCPNNKVERAETSGVFEMLRIEVGVEIRVCECVGGSKETVIVVSSKEAPDDELFPAQEALLHIQSQIVDLGPDKDNVISTRLLVPSKEISHFNNNNNNDLFSEIRRSCSANVQVLPKEDLPVCASESDELIQIVGEIRAARNALVQVTEKLRSFIYKEFYYSDNISPKELYHPQRIAVPGPWNHNKDLGPSASGSFEQQEVSNVSEETRQNNIKRFGVPMVARSTLEVIIPKGLVEILAMRSRNKLAQISELSGATVSLVEEINETLERVVRISGSPEQADKAQSLLQGFILSIQDDLPSS
ncbi:hypothetical protein LUZ60_012541 [Juncus effusus]|nr:hypothetical protein LUZ60_012541 [Juncus effusus]